MKPQFQIKPDDVTWRMNSSASGPLSGPRSSRARQVRGSQLTLIHVPSGVEVSGDVPAGSYTRKAMVEEQAKLRDRLMVELERAVASHLRSPGR
jgi:hypothetical protein